MSRDVAELVRFLTMERRGEVFQRCFKEGEGVDVIVPLNGLLAAVWKFSTSIHCDRSPC